MSAYLCSNDTFDYIVTTAARLTTGGPHLPVNVYVRQDMPDVPELISEGLLTSWNDKLILHCDQTRIAAILRYQNVRSLKARYPDDFEAFGGDEPYAYSNRDIPKINHATALKSLACLEYQSCETDDYQQTFAYHLLKAIEGAIISHLPGYDEAPWGWERPTTVNR